MSLCQSCTKMAFLKRMYHHEKLATDDETAEPKATDSSKELASLEQELLQREFEKSETEAQPQPAISSKETAVVEPETDFTATSKTEQQPRLYNIPPIIEKSEIQHIQELGLGRAINSTDPHMWRNKPPIQIRDIGKDLSNVIGTNENGFLQRYEKIVSSLESQQSRIKLALFIPSSTVHIGLDAHYSQSTTSTVTVTGTKVRTRTISFKSDLEDLPTEFYDNKLKLLDKDRSFESNMATWLLSYLQTKQKSKELPSDPDLYNLEGDSDIEKLVYLGTKIDTYDSKQAKAILLACQMFVFAIGITHYVSSIELGATRYTAEANTTFKISDKFGENIHAASAASESGQVDIVKETKLFTEKEQLIGHYDSETAEVRRDTRDEAVIGFHITPICKLLRTPLLQLAMRSAIEIYIEQGQDTTSGPFLVLTTINKKPVYWKVEQDFIMATNEVNDASLFYFLPSGKDNSFAIAYWGDDPDDRQKLTDTIHFHSGLSKKIAKLPRFVTASVNSHGYSKEPLRLKSTYDSKESKFTLYDRAQSSFACISWVSNSVSVQTWIEGEEYFLKHKNRPFKSDYVSIVEEDGQLVSAVQPWIINAENGMLFRLQSSSRKKRTQISDNDDDASKILKVAGKLSLFGLKYSILELESLLLNRIIDEELAL